MLSPAPCRLSSALLCLFCPTCSAPPYLSRLLCPLRPASARVLCRLSLVKAARYPCIDLVCITCPTAKTSSGSAPLPSTLSQIQFKFFSGIYFGPPNAFPHSLSMHKGSWHSCHAASKAATAASSTLTSDPHSASSCCPAPLCCIPFPALHPFPLPCQSFSLFVLFFGVFYVECCNFNPLMDLMKLAGFFFAVCICCKISGKSVPKSS